MRRRRRRTPAQATATRKVFRIKLSPDDVNLSTGALKQQPIITPSTALATLLQNDPVIGPFFDQPLDENGLTVEGVAVRGENLYAGLRGPVLADGSAVIARVPLAALFDGAPGAATVFKLALGADTLGAARGIRDLTVSGDGFLLIAGPEIDPPKKHKISAGDYAIYSWNEGVAEKRIDLPVFSKRTSPKPWRS
jgi:hypothetical protein